ncbi:MAG: hypothetical protein C4303_06415, partial [candidate division GAL15 bacterium]
MALIQPQGELLYNRIAPITQPEALNSPLLDLLNVKYILSELPIDNPRLTLVYDGEVKVYRNEEALPRAFTLPLGCAVTSADVKQALQRYDPRHYVILEGPERAPGADPALCTPTAATVTSYQPGEVWVDVALAVHADGVHVGQEDVPVADARQLMGPGRVVGASAGNVEEALQAEQASADYLGVGPVFPTATKPDA